MTMIKKESLPLFFSCNTTLVTCVMYVAWKSKKGINDDKEMMMIIRGKDNKEEERNGGVSIRGNKRRLGKKKLSERYLEMML